MTQKKKAIVASLSLIALILLLCVIFLFPNFDMSQEKNSSQTPYASAEEPMDTTGYWIDENRRASGFAGGSGTRADPYEIENAEQLAYLSWTVYSNNAHGGAVTVDGTISYFYSGIYFEQTADIDLSSYYWQPIGMGYNREGVSMFHWFSGNYDGNGYTISGLYTPSGTGNSFAHQGLFGYIYGRTNTNRASISNIGVIDSHVQGYDNCGGISGYAVYTNITDCYFSGQIDGGHYIGGITGYTYYITIERCYNTGNVNGDTDVGGIVGRGAYTNIYDCYNIGSVVGLSSNDGGIAGSAFSSSVIINCYNTGSVIGANQSVGGLIGSTTASSVYNSFNIGTVANSSQYIRNIGGLVGFSSSTISSCYYGGNCELTVGLGNTTIDTDGQVERLDDIATLAKTEAWYTDESLWNGSYPWEMGETWFIFETMNDGYPVLEIYFWIDIFDFDNYLLEGEGSESNPYLIQSEQDIAFLSWSVYNDQAYNNLSTTAGDIEYFYSGIYFKQTNNLNLEGCYWQPIGIAYTREGSSTQRYFSGNYDGGGYSISGVRTPTGTSNQYSNQGLFGYVYGVTIGSASFKNINVMDANIQGRDNLGVIAGTAQRAIIENCSSIGSVSSTEMYIGGVIGSGAYLTINECYNFCEVTNTNSSVSGGYIGGIIGSGGGTVTISNCYNYGSVSMTRQNIVSSGYNVGGIVGSLYSYPSSADMLNCYNFGTITSPNNNVGGVAGYIYGAVTVTGCFNMGIVNGYSCVGGIVGNVTRATIQSCFNSGDVNGESSSIGGVVGRTSQTTIADCGFEGDVTTESPDTSTLGALAGSVESGSSIENCYAISGMAEQNYAGGESDLVSNCVLIYRMENEEVKAYIGSDFSGFAWINGESCPMPKGLAWLGEIWEGSVTEQDLIDNGFVLAG